MRLLGNVFLLVLAAATAYLLVRCLIDGMEVRHKGRTPGLNDELDNE